MKHNWGLQYRLWPQLETAQHSEKPSITALVKSITGYIHRCEKHYFQLMETDQFSQH